MLPVETKEAFRNSTFGTRETMLARQVFSEQHPQGKDDALAIQFTNKLKML